MKTGRYIIRRSNKPNRVFYNYDDAKAFYDSLREEKYFYKTGDLLEYSKGAQKAA